METQGNFQQHEDGINWLLEAIDRGYQWRVSSFGGRDSRRNEIRIGREKVVRRIGRRGREKKIKERKEGQ
jgi:hypothetical protein